jgi:hypothetical protein
MGVMQRGELKKNQGSWLDVFLRNLIEHWIDLYAGQKLCNLICRHDLDSTSCHIISSIISTDPG